MKYLLAALLAMHAVGAQAAPPEKPQLYVLEIDGCPYCAKMNADTIPALDRAGILALFDFGVRNVDHDIGADGLHQGESFPQVVMLRAGKVYRMSPGFKTPLEITMFIDGAK
jgi:hypothetical protein